MNKKRAFSAALSALLVLGNVISFTGCNSKNYPSDGNKIAKDDPWYDAVVTEVSGDIPDNRDNFYCYSPVLTNDLILIPINATTDDFSYEYGYVTKLFIYDRNGNFPASTGTDSSDIEGVATENGKATCYLQSKNGHYVSRSVLDPETYELEEIQAFFAGQKDLMT